MEHVRGHRFGFIVHLHDSRLSSGTLTYLLLGGQTPFVGATDFETLQNIRNGSWSFGDRLSHVTPDAKDFITRLLVNDQQNRLTSEQALNHPWLKYALQHADAPAIASDRLQGAYSRQLYEVSFSSSRRASSQASFLYSLFSVNIDVR